MLNTQVRMCVGDSTSPEPDSASIDFLWEMCNQDYEPCELDGNDATRATMSIDQVSATLVINMFNQTILAVSPNISTLTPYAIDLYSFYEAYTSPLNYSRVSFSEIYEAEQENNVFPATLLTTNSSSNAVDVWVDSSYYGLKKYLKPAEYHQRVYGIVAHALAANSRKHESDHIQRTWTKAVARTILSVSFVSIYVFTALAVGVILLCPVMIFWAGRRNLPNISLFPDLMIMAKVEKDLMELLHGKELTDASSRQMVEKLVDEYIWVTRSNGHVHISPRYSMPSPKCDLSESGLDSNESTDPHWETSRPIRTRSYSV